MSSKGHPGCSLIQEKQGTASEDTEPRLLVIWLDSLSTQLKLSEGGKEKEWGQATEGKIRIL